MLTKLSLYHEHPFFYGRINLEVLGEVVATMLEYTQTPEKVQQAKEKHTWRPSAIEQKVLGLVERRLLNAERARTLTTTEIIETMRESIRRLYVWPTEEAKPNAH